MKVPRVAAVVGVDSGQLGAKKSLRVDGEAVIMEHGTTVGSASDDVAHGKSICAIVESIPALQDVYEE
ncbi:hypothetical protein Tco_1501021 [Tanacetum coccineum]